MKRKPNKQLSKAEKLSKQGEHDLAIEICNVVVHENPDWYECYETRSSIFRRAGDIQHAIADIDRVIQLEPLLAAPYFRKGRYLMQCGQYEGAVTAFSEAVKLDDGYFGDAIFFFRAEALLRIDEYEACLRDCQAIQAEYFEMNFFDHKIRAVADIRADAEAGLKKAKIR